MIHTFKAAIHSRTSIFYRASYIAALLAAGCAVIAQGAVALLAQPVYTDARLMIPYINYQSGIDTPWSADMTLAPYNAGRIQSGILGANWAFLERIIGATLGDSQPVGYLVPMHANSNNSDGTQYPTDVVRVQCACQWVAPTLPDPVSNVSYIPVTLDVLGIEGIQSVPYGVASECPVYCAESELMLRPQRLPHCLT